MKALYSFKMNNTTPLMGLDEQMNVQFAGEKSRTVKVCMLKYKCILLFTFLLLSSLEFIYIMYKETRNDEGFQQSLLSLLGKVTNKTHD
jgi:K+ transporter